MLTKGAIESGQNPWAHPVVLVLKKDGPLRFCVDYRKVINATQFDAYPLLCIDETFKALSGTKFFSLLRPVSNLAAFHFRIGLYLWNVMPFRLTNAPSIFERLMKSVLCHLQWKICLFYPDVIDIFCKSESELLYRMDMAFSRLRMANLKLKPKKCKLFTRRTEFPGHILSEAGIRCQS